MCTMNESNENSKTKKLEKVLGKVNWKYVAIYSCLTLVTGLILIVINVSNDKNRLLFFALGGTFTFIGCVCILLSCCFYDEFKGMELTQTNAIVSPDCDDKTRLHRNSSSTCTSLTSGSPTSLFPPVMESPWSPKSPVAPCMSFLAVPKEVLGFDHDRRLSTSSSNHSTASAPPFSISIVLPRVSV